MNKIAVKVEGVSKDFKITHEQGTTLKSHFVSIFNGKKNRTTEMQYALIDIDFEVREGEFFGIVGRNGSGKSTLLKIIAGIYQPGEGSVQVNGRLVPFIELGVGFNPELTGRENVYLNGALLGFSEKEVNAFYDEVVKFAELEKFMDKKLKNYSSGMQVRLAFSMAIRARADILLVDEVLAVGDSEFQRKCFEYFRKAKRLKKTVIFVGHDMNVIREYCDRGIMIEQGKVQVSGRSKDVADAYTRLFSEEWDSPQHGKKQINRHGNKEIEFKDVSTEPKNVITNQKSIKIHAIIQANNPSENILAGISVTNTFGVSLMGTNNKLLNKKIRSLHKGDQLKLTWTIPNVFNDGVYEINLSLMSETGEIHDWWDDAVTIRVGKETGTGFLVQPDIELEISDKSTLSKAV